MEISVPAWQPGLAIAKKLDIERVQKSVCLIILGSEFSDYNEALATLGLDTLENRRRMLCKTFVLKTYEEKKFSHWFIINDNKSKTRSTKTKFKNIYTRTKRLEKSPIPYLTKNLNSEWERREKMPLGWKFKN